MMVYQLVISLVQNQIDNTELHQSFYYRIGDVEEHPNTVLSQPHTSNQKNEDVNKVFENQSNKGKIIYSSTHKFSTYMRCKFCN